MNLKQHKVSARHGKRWDAPLVTSSAPTSADFVQAEVRESFRLRPALSKRGQRWEAPLVSGSSAATNADFIQAELRESFRAKIMLLRRGHRFNPPWSISTVPPAAISPAAAMMVQAERRRAYRLPRGKLLIVPPVQTFPLLHIRPKRKPLAIGRRGRRWELLVQQLLPVAVTRSVRRAASLVRRGKILQPVLAQVVVPAAPSYPPVTIRGKRRFSMLRRGRRWDVIRTQLAPVVTVWTPAVIASRVRAGVLIRRGRRGQPVPSQESPSRSGAFRHPRAVIVRTRARQLAQPQQAVVTTTSARRARTPRAVRGRRWDAIVQVVAPVLLPWVAPVIRARHLPVLLVRRRRYGNLLVVHVRRVLAQIRTGETADNRGGRTEDADGGSVKRGSGGEIL